MNINRYIEMLKMIAEDVEPCGNAKLAAMVVYKNKMISVGVNQNKTHPFAAKYSKHPEAIYLHAETAAILSAKKKLTGQQLKKSTLIVCRVITNKTGDIVYRIAKPCSGCEKCIEEHGIQKLIYTVNSDLGKLKYITELLF